MKSIKSLVLLANDDLNHSVSWDEDNQAWAVRNDSMGMNSRFHKALCGALTDMHYSTSAGLPYVEYCEEVAKKWSYDY